MTSFDSLLRRLAKENPVRITRNDVRWYSRQIASLRKEGLLEDTTPVTSIHCPQCDQPHSLEVGREENVPFVVCHECGLVRVTDDDLRCSVLRITTLLAWLCRTLRMESDVQEVVEDVLWKMGMLTYNNIVHPCFFLRRIDLSDDIMHNLNSAQNAVVFYLGPEVFDVRSFLPVSLSACFFMHEGKIRLPSAQELLSGGRVIHLLPDGIVLVGRSQVGLIPPGTVHFWFFELLHTHAGQVVSYDEVYRHVLSKDGKVASAVSKNAPGYCQNLKNELKRKKCLPDDLVNHIIETGKTAEGKRGYALRRSVTLSENPLRA